MNDLMLHVEQIVRPVRALQPRKLRMRRELLAHMQNAMDEERAGGADETTAIARAKQRIGEPAELTRSLQSSVPAIERTLLARMPGSDAFDRLERHSPMASSLTQRTTLLHRAVLLLGTIALIYTALLALALQIPRHAFAASVSDKWRFAFLNAFAVAMFFWLLKICMDVCVTAATAPWPLSRLGLRAMQIMTLLVVFSLLYIELLARLPMTPQRLLFTAVVGVSLIASLLLLGGLIRLLRGRYEQWLTLDVAG